MKTRLSLALLLGAAAAFAADSAANRTPLFNGRDLTGWRLFTGANPAELASVVTVADGIVRISGKPNGYIRTEQTFSNYRLHLEWRWQPDAANNANSGVLLHVTGDDTIWPKSIEAQLRTGNAGQVIAMGGADFAGEPVNNRKRAARLADSSEKKHGEWNTYEIICRGDTIEITINGVRQNRIEKAAPSSGAIALQSEGAPIEFRNVWVEKL